MTAIRSMPKRSPDFSGWTMWSRDGVGALMPTPDPRWPSAVLTLYMMRVEANLSGQCPSCLVTVDALPAAPRQARGTMAHAKDCPVGDADYILAATYREASA